LRAAPPTGRRRQSIADRHLVEPNLFVGSEPASIERGIQDGGLMKADAAALRMQMRSALLRRFWVETPAQLGLQHLAVIVLGQRLDKPVGARPLKPNFALKWL
jgi:hypothetical protein